MWWSRRNESDIRNVSAVDEQEGHQEEGRSRLLTLADYLSAGDGVIDLGANTGKYTKEYARIVGPLGKVLAVEPDRENCAALIRAFRERPEVEIVEAAVGSQAHPSMPFWHDRMDARRSSVWYHNVPRPEDNARFVPTVTLDSLSATVPNLKAIKVDVQGAECHVLDGAQETLARDLVWYVELWPEGLQHAGRSVEELARQFQAFGYEAEHPDAQGWAAILQRIAHFVGHKSTDVIVRKPTSPESTSR